MNLLYDFLWLKTYVASDRSTGLSHLSLTVTFRTLDRTMKQDSFLRTSLPDTPRDKPYHIDHIVFRARLLDHISNKVRLPLGHRTCLRCLFVHLSECSLGIDSEVLQTHRRLGEM